MLEYLKVVGRTWTSTENSPISGLTSRVKKICEIRRRKHGLLRMLVSNKMCRKCFKCIRVKGLNAGGSTDRHVKTFCH